MRTERDDNEGEKPILELRLDDLGFEGEGETKRDRHLISSRSARCRLKKILEDAQSEIENKVGPFTLPKKIRPQRGSIELLVGEDHLARVTVMQQTNVREWLVVHAPVAKPPPITLPRRAGKVIKGVLPVSLVLLIIFSMLLSLLYDEFYQGPRADWREPVALHYAEGTGWWIGDNGTLVEQFGNNSSGLVPGDQLQLGEVPSSHLLERYYWSCWTTCSGGYGADCYTDCVRTDWAVFSVSIGGMEFILDGGDDFVARCFNAVCRINATVDGDAWEVTKEGGRVVLEPTSYEWVRWCQGEVFCE